MFTPQMIILKLPKCVLCTPDKVYKSGAYWLLSNVRYFTDENAIIVSDFNIFILLPNKYFER